LFGRESIDELLKGTDNFDDGISFIKVKNLKIKECQELIIKISSYIED